MHDRVVQKRRVRVLEKDWIGQVHGVPALGLRPVTRRAVAVVDGLPPAHVPRVQTLGQVKSRRGLEGAEVGDEGGDLPRFEGAAGELRVAGHGGAGASTADALVQEGVARRREERLADEGGGVVGGITRGVRRVTQGAILRVERGRVGI